MQRRLYLLLGFRLDAAPWLALSGPATFHFDLRCAGSLLSCRVGASVRRQLSLPLSYLLLPLPSICSL